MKISYLITSHNESDTLDKCLTNVIAHKDIEDEVIILDDFSDNPNTIEIFNKWKDSIQLIPHKLDRNYSQHKNFGNEQCKNPWIFQIDGDEIPNPNLIINIKSIIELNPTIELIFVSRINDYIGVTIQDAKTWGWRLTPCPECDNRPIVNAPDFQGRIYKNDPSRIHWERRLHEKIEGHASFTTLPFDFNLALYHEKTMATQLKTNIRYNEWFTIDENRGHTVFGQKTK
jgi:glycosyltransferase involved in cell wall biosynthesis